MNESQMSTKEQVALDSASDFLDDHLYEAALEIQEWAETAILRDGVIRRAALILAPLGTDFTQRLAIAQSLANRKALAFVIESFPLHKK